MTAVLSPKRCSILLHVPTASSYKDKTVRSGEDLSVKEVYSVLVILLNFQLIKLTSMQNY